MRYIGLKFLKYFICRLVKRILGNGLVLSEGKTHAVHKRLMSPAFNRASASRKRAKLKSFSNRTFKVLHTEQNISLKSQLRF